MKLRPTLWLPTLLALAGAGAFAAWSLGRDSTPAPDTLAPGAALEPPPLPGGQALALLHLGKRVGRVDERALARGLARSVESRIALRVRRGSQVAVTTRTLVAELDATGALLSAELRASPLRVRAVPERSEVVLGIALGERTREFRVPAPPELGPVHVEASLWRALRARPRPSAGRVQLVDLEQARLRPVTFDAKDLPDGTTELELRDGFGVTWRTRVDDAGVVSGEAPIPGVSTRRWRPEDDTAPAREVDLAAFGEVMRSGPLPAEGSPLHLRLRGLPPGFPTAHLDAAPGPDGTFVARLRLGPQADPPAAPDATSAEARAPSPLVESDAPEIAALAKELGLAAMTPLRAARAVAEHVQRTLRIADAVGPPSALSTLRAGRGNCNELASLAVALLRAGGHAARLCFGVARLGEALRYHAWGEVRSGDGWRAFDPTLGRAPVDGTHLRLSAGGIEAQGAILAATGRLTLESLEPPK